MSTVMPQVFHPSTNTISRLTIFGFLFVIAFISWASALINRSGYTTLAQVAREQPVQFSHRHHAGQLGIDCRYCHTSVENAGFANLPPTQTCMNCHAQIWIDSPFLEPVRASFRSNESIRWIKVHALPDFVYFNHSIHVNKGVGCVTCHGRVDQMNLTWKANSLLMEWCLNCHRHPERYVRPRERVFDMDWQPQEDQATLGARLVAEYHIRTLDDCNTCHR